MANSVDLMRMFFEEQSDLGLHCLHMPFYQKLWYQNFWTVTIVTVRRNGLCIFRITMVSCDVSKKKT